MPATWTSPRTYTIGELITKSILDTHVRDNLLWLKTPAAAIDTVSGISTTSASLVDVTGSSISVTTTGTGGVDVFWVGTFSVTVTATVTLALVVDGATIFSIPYATSMTGFAHGCSFPYHLATLSAAAHTIKMQVSTNAGTATITGYLTYGVERGA